MSDLAAFLLERIGETERECDLFGARWDPTGRLTALLRRDCGAMRKIVQRHADCDDTSFGEPCDDLRDIAMTFADHPDFRPEWRP